MERFFACRISFDFANVKKYCGGQPELSHKSHYNGKIHQIQNKLQRIRQNASGETILLGL
jgi:hypothetical protein